MAKGDSIEAFAALTEEARRRGTSYGKFVARTTFDERREIVIKYHKARQARAKRKAR